MVRVSLSAAIEEVSNRDPVVAHLVELVGPIRHRPPNPDGHFGAIQAKNPFPQLKLHRLATANDRLRAAEPRALAMRVLEEIPT